jgi:hypothetical protein
MDAPNGEARARGVALTKLAHKLGIKPGLRYFRAIKISLGNILVGKQARCDLVRAQSPRAEHQ